MEIQAGTPALISHDIVIENQYAFRHGERVVVETVTPNSQRPEYKYVVFSQQLQKRFQLSGSDIGLLADTSVPREVVSGSAPILQKQRRVIGSNFYKRLVVFGSIVLVSIAIVVLVVFLLEVGKQNKTEKAEKRVVTPTPAKTEDKPYTVGIADGKGEITINSVARTGGDGTNESDTLQINVTLKNNSSDNLMLFRLEPEKVDLELLRKSLCLPFGIQPWSLFLGLGSPVTDHPQYPEISQHYKVVNTAGGVTRIQNGTGSLIAATSNMKYEIDATHANLLCGETCTIDYEFPLDPTSVLTRKDFNISDGIFVIDGYVGFVQVPAGQEYYSVRNVVYMNVQLNIPLSGIP